MEPIIKHLIIIASLMTVELTVTESKYDKKKIKIDRPYHHPVFTNICDISDRRSKVHCYCDNTKPKMATSADCWVFAGEITENDPIWPSFSSQPLIENLIFNVRSDDALTFIPGKALIRLDNLRHLTIQFGSIPSIPPFAFTNSSTVRQISLKSNKITSLEENSFSKLMMLSNLSLEDNNISELKRDVFFGLPNLHVLHISNNNISLIHEGCFKHLNNLIELKLDSNYVSVVTREMFEGLENLARLDLRSNKLTMIGNLAFSDLWGLKELALDNNAIEYISDRSFGGLNQLKKLTLSGNKLTAFYEDIIEYLENLVVLDLSDNLLETITYETIRSVIEQDKSVLRAVYLDGNPLICDCRLSWIYAIINKTEDKTLKKTLEKVSCITDETLSRRLNNNKEIESNESLSENKITYENDYYYDEKNDKDVLYDEPKKTENDGKVKLTDIPIESLPCPKELLRTIEESNHPVQNEIRLKAFSKSNKIAVNCIISVGVSARMLF